MRPAAGGDSKVAAGTEACTQAAARMRAHAPVAASRHHRRLLLPLLAVLCMLGSPSYAAGCQEVVQSDDDSVLLRNFSMVLRCTGVPAVMLPYVWSPVTVKIECGIFQV